MTSRHIPTFVILGLLLCDAPIRASGHGKCQDPCETMGLCIPKKTGCIATSDEHCKQSQACFLEGACKEKQRCLPTTDGDCKKSKGCKKKGHCCLAAGNLAKIMHVMVCGPCT